MDETLVRAWTQISSGWSLGAVGNIETAHMKNHFALSAGPWIELKLTRKADGAAIIGTAGCQWMRFNAVSSFAVWLGPFCLG